MEIKEIKNLNITELHKMLAEKRSELMNLRFKDANKQLKNVREIRSIKKTIAQVQTILKTKTKAQ